MHTGYWQQGYMKESLIEVLNYLFTHNFENVFCDYSEGNIKSKNY